MIQAKTLAEVKIMAEGGARLAGIKETLLGAVKPGITPIALDTLADKLIAASGGAPSFKMVKGYRWATCININSGVVHGIPTDIPLKSDDLVSIDVGMFYKGFHTDTSFTACVGVATPTLERFLAAGREALSASIKEVRVGKRVSHISRAMQAVLKKYGYSPVRALIGHGIGRLLHEEPQIPCFWDGRVEDGQLLTQGAVLAIEVIYTQGAPDLVLASDGWTIETKDGKIAGLFEETVAVGARGPRVLTA